ncbi:MAG: DUF4446 family protein [Chloroflexota bacterium]
MNVDSLRTFVDQNSFIFLVGLGMLFLISLASIVALLTRTRRLEERLNRIFNDVSGDNTAQMLTEYLAVARSASVTVEKMKAQHDKIVSLMPSAVRHVGLIRFSPFHDTGGDQSFALALLDGRGDGIVLTALHSRNDSRLYAKPIERGASSYSLTPEERQAMDTAIHGSLSETTASS